MILGVGVDLVQIERLRTVNPRLFLRICTEAERAFCDRFENDGRLERYAGRFAVKEAVSKALGTGIAAGVQWTDIEALPLPSGAPEVRLHGKALERMLALGGERVHVSISHDKGHAVAMAVLEGPGPG